MVSRMQAINTILNSVLSLLGIQLLVANLDLAGVAEEDLEVVAVVVGN